MRCQQCQKFVGVDAEVEPEHDLDYDDGKVFGNVTIVNQCSECGTDLQTASFDVDLEVLVPHEENCPTKDTNEDVIATIEVTRFDEFRPPKARRQAHHYCVEVSGTATCGACKASAEFSHRDDVKSSQMDEC